MSLSRRSALRLLAGAAVMPAVLPLTGARAQASGRTARVGGLAAATSFQAGSPGFRNHVNAAELRRVLGLPDRKD